MAFVDVNPRYCDLLARQGLSAPADFSDWQGVFVGGHADRSIARVVLGDGSERITAYLKREQPIRWRHRLRSAWAGFGFVSRCCREARILWQLQQADIACPEVIAAGEDNHGRAFLLVRELSHTTELRQFLHAECPSSRARREVAVLLGGALAKVHNAGFQHADLYSKHVLVRRDAQDGSLSFAFLDWQRSRRRRRMAWSRCCRDLAALDATLADDLATRRERLACLVAYCRQRRQLGALPIKRAAGFTPAVRLTAAVNPTAHRLGRIARTIRRHALRLLRRRRITEMRQPPLGIEGQSLVHADSKNVSLTRQFHEELRGELPTWLRLSTPWRQNGPQKAHIKLPGIGEREAMLVRQRVSQPFRWLWRWLGGKPLVSAEVEQAGTLFRLERYGIRAPRLLAFGQRRSRPWRLDSLLLTEAPAHVVSLEKWFRGTRGPALDRERRRHLIREVGAVLRKLHAAACYVVGSRLADAFRVQALPGRPEQIVLAEVGVLRRRHRPSARRAFHDLVMLHARFETQCNRTDLLRFLAAYLDLELLNPAARRLARRLLHARLHGRAIQRRAGT